MNRWTRMALAASALFVISAPILAQTPDTAQTPTAKVKGAKRAGQGRRASLATVPVEVIDALVTLNADQKTKIADIQSKLKTDTATAAGDKVKTRELSTTASSDIKAVLTADQQTVLTDKLPVVTLLNQSKAVPYGVLGEVKLTSDEMDKIKPIVVSTQDKMKAIPQADRKTKNPEILADFKTQVDAVLTDDQKAIVAKYHAPKGKGKKKATA